jgi:hypothetical protein
VKGIRDTEGRALKAERARQAQLNDDIDAALTAKGAPDLSAFIPRERYADTLKILLRLLIHRFNEPPLEAIRGGGLFMVFRVACQCKVIASHRWSKRPFTLADLEDFAHSIKPAKRRQARLALACLGHLDWRDASRTERAAWMLCTLATYRVPS